MSNNNYTQKALEDYINKLGENNQKQIYNIKDEETPFILQYRQLIEYLKFRNEFNKNLEVWNIPLQNQNFTLIDYNFNDIWNNSKYIQSCCLIDKKWIEKWRKHVGYDEIKNKLKNENIILEDNMYYDWIIKIIENNSKQNLLSPLDNNEIYKDNEIICDADFEPINNECYKLFSLGAKKTKDITNYSKIRVVFLKEKYIALINNSIFWIVFKEKTKQILSEILLKFTYIENSIDKKDIISNITKKDINDWVNEIGFKLTSDIEKEFTLHNCKFLLINKTLQFIQRKSINCNAMEPTIMNKEKELLNINNNNLPNELINSINQQTFINLHKFGQAINQEYKINENNNSEESKNNIQNHINNNNNQYILDFI